MPGTKSGGLKAATTNKERHGADFYKRVGQKGGSVLGTKGGFASMPPERRAELGRKGGIASRRTGIKNKKGNTGILWESQLQANSTSSTSGTSRPKELSNNFGAPSMEDLAVDLIAEAEAINRGEKLNRYETVTVETPKPGLFMPKRWYEWWKL